ncbi:MULTISPECIES: AAA family ATPase [unclassified Paraflavitalea]|uniref:AAA family ATPase n=1 Tax=unclassified Paraflavitalea TaxID=2798305 RepID=UPI003D3595F0
MTSKIELLYIYIFDFKSLKNIEIVLSNKFKKCKYDSNKNSIEFEYELDIKNSIYGNEITNIHAIVGANGVGKSTVFDFLCSLLNGDINSSSGFLIYSNSGTVFTNQINLNYSNNNFEIFFDDLLKDFKSEVDTVLINSSLDISRLQEEQISKKYVNDLSFSQLIVNSSKKYLHFEDSSIKRLPLQDAVNYYKVLENSRIIVALSWLIESEKELNLSFNFPTILNIEIVEMPKGQFTDFYHNIIGVIESKVKSFTDLDFFNSKLLLTHYFLILENRAQSSTFLSSSEIKDRLQKFLALLGNDMELNKIKKFKDLYRLMIDTLKLENVLLFRSTDFWRVIREDNLGNSVIVSKRNIRYRFDGKNQQNQFISWLLSYLGHARYISALEVKISHAENFETSLSAGEYSLLSLLGKVFISGEQKDNILFLFDEVDINLHPEWQRKLVNILINVIQLRFSVKNSQLIFTTHSPFILSDIVSENVSYLDRDSSGIVYSRKPQSGVTFGANIYKMLSDSFFMKEAFIGDFAVHFIREIIEEIKHYKGKESEKEDSIRYKINLISDDIIRLTLNDMLDSKTNT